MSNPNNNTGQVNSHMNKISRGLKNTNIINKIIYKFFI